MTDKNENAPLRYATVLVIAGSDSIGGAGIQADIKTCTSLGVYAMTAVTAVTAQNTCGVSCYEAVSGQMLRAQLRAVLDDVRPDAVKIGMLPNAEAVQIVAETIRERGLTNVVLDPVCVATSGDRLNDDDSVVNVMKAVLMPLADIVTPNVPELEVLTGIAVSGGNVTEAAERLLADSGCRAVLAKGGHLPGDTIIDILVSADGSQFTMSHDFVDTPNTHGTGCTLSSAIAACMACGDKPTEAVRDAIIYINAAIGDGARYTFGHGHGPVNHMYHIKQSK